MSTDTGPDPLSPAERKALKARYALMDLLDSTCKHLHSPDTCPWCARSAELKASAQARDGDYAGFRAIVVDGGAAPETR